MKDDDQEFAENEHEPDVYEEEDREALEEDDEITPEEEGFMKGYQEGKKMSACPKCGTVLVQNFVEREIKGEIYRFCSERCSEAFHARG